MSDNNNHSDAKSIIPTLPTPLRVIRGSYVLHHWYRLVPNLSISPIDFYTAVESALRERKVPGLEASRPEWHEGGTLTSKRIYLRLARERVAFDICAAQFGVGFFFSCRFTYNPSPLNPFAIAGLFFILVYLLQLFARQFGLLWGPLGLVGLCAAACWFMRNADTCGAGNLDQTFLDMPLIGGLYERFIRRETYYRIDTRLMYLQTVPTVVEEVVDEFAGSHGLDLSSLETPALHRMIKPPNGGE